MFEHSTVLFTSQPDDLDGSLTNTTRSKRNGRMATNQPRPSGPSHDYSADDAPVTDETGETDATITRPFVQGNSIVLAVTKYFDEDQPLFLFERHVNGRTCLIIEEAFEP